ncbi:hypothetical protein, partial [Stieleria sp.]|uniref:hypothetical protein n=1 Tax=Stieleria sp. TaxID=2795976 RepID=UPI00356B30C9
MASWKLTCGFGLASWKLTPLWAALHIDTERFCFSVAMDVGVTHNAFASSPHFSPLFSVEWSSMKKSLFDRPSLAGVFLVG